MVSSMRRPGGFTMIEMIVAIALSAIVAGFVAMFISSPVRSYVAQKRRAELAESAETAARWMTQDVAAAVPNSVRQATVSGRVILEMIPVIGIGIYRHAGTEGDILDFTAPDNQFDVLGPPGVAGATHVIVNNLGTAGANAYALANVISAATIVANSSRITLTPAFKFAAPSPNRRAYLVSKVTRYECDLSAGTLRRYADLPITPTIALSGAASTLIATDLATCRFVIRPGTTRHGGLVVLEFTLARATDGDVENLRVLRQIEVENPS